MANQLRYHDQIFAVGDTINVSVKVKEGDKIRLQLFTGLLIGVRGREDNTSFTVRKIGSHGIGVERIFPIKSPDIASITRKAAGTARRSKLGYLRDRTGRLALRVKSVEDVITPVVDEKSTAKTGSTGRKASQKTA